MTNDRIIRLKGYLEKQPGDSFLQHALALEFVKMGNDPEARLLFEAIVKNDPGYVGSYYHLGRLLERADAPVEASAIYEAGIKQARAAGDQHAANELRMAIESI